MEFYIKNDSGEYAPATESDYEAAFRERSDRIVTKRLHASVANALEKERPEFLKKIQAEETARIREEVEKEYQPKLTEANQKAAELENKLLRRDILSEYGLKPDAEEFLGDGTAEEMRARADKLKGGFAHQDIKVPEKTSGEPKSRTQEEYGLDVKI